MNIREIKRPITAAQLNESLAQKYGTKISIDKFTLEQLEDARNKLRTQLRDIETNESFDAVHSEAYQKSKLFLDVLTTAIAEAEKKAAKDYDKDGKIETPSQEYKGSRDKAIKRAMGKKVKEAEDKMPSKAHIMKMCKDGKTKAEICKMHPDCDQGKLKDMIDDCMKEMKESIIREGEEDKAELVMAAKDMVDRVTGWMEDTAEMQSESMLELADAIRDEMGAEASETFTSTIKPALESMYTAMEATRISLTQGVGQLTGEGEPMPDMGAEEDPAMEPTVDADAEADVDMGDEPADDTAVDAATAGGEEEAGRETRESVERSRKLGTILSKKK